MKDTGYILIAVGISIIPKAIGYKITDWQTWATLVTTALVIAFFSSKDM